MSDDPLYQRLREQSWRQALTPDEQSELQGWLLAHPEAQADWEAETALNQTLELLPDAPVPSNFTARVLQAVERETTAATRAGRERGIWLLVQRWLPRAALATVVLGVGLFTYHQAEAKMRLRGMVRSVAAVSEVSSLPSPDILKDFDTICALNQTPAADEELLALLK